MSKAKAPVPEHAAPSGEKVLARLLHTELLLFEVFTLLEEVVFNTSSIDGETIVESETYQRARQLYKSLAHGRRPDGSKY